MLTDKITNKARGYLSTKYEKLYFNFTKKQEGTAIKYSMINIILLRIRNFDVINL